MQVKYISEKESQLKMIVDAGSGTEYWSVEGSRVQFTRFVVPANTVFQKHRHKSEQITYVLEGELFFETENTVYKISKGDCILIPENKDHAVWTENNPAVAVDAWSPVNENYISENKK